jgi:hypothetical protein
MITHSSPAYRSHHFSEDKDGLAEDLQTFVDDTPGDLIINENEKEFIDDVESNEEDYSFDIVEDNGDNNESDNGSGVSNHSSLADTINN